MAEGNPSESADTVPAASSEPPERERRPTIPDLAPPFEQRYRLGAELGRGGMGRVVEAFDTQLGRTVALKEVLPRPGGAVDRRFEREVQITARLEHPSIVPLYDAGTMADGRPFYVMRKVTGRPLDELISRAHDLEERLVLLPNLLSAMDAIAHAHKRGIIHRDLKPGNILVGDNGETIVIDWGLAKVLGEESIDEAGETIIPSAADSLKTIAGAVFGTPGFMAPEQARGEELTTRGDVFALGATLYQLLVGRAPVSGKSATEAIASSIQRKITPVAEASPNAPVELVAIVEKALAFEADDRYPNAGGLAEDVRRFTTGQLVAAHRYTRRERLIRFAKRHRAPLSVAALALVVVAVFAWIGVHRILVERDAANSARHEADEQRGQVLKANAQLVERADQLLVTRARALVDSNPTEALALLKELRATSTRLADARALAQAAVARGVAWGLHAEGAPGRLAVDADVSHLAELTTDGTLHVWDLITHRVLYERMYAQHALPVWITGNRLLLFRGDVEQLDPRTGASEKLPQLPLSTYGIATEDGTHVAVLGNEGEVGVYDVAKKAWAPLWAGHKADSIEYAPDGSWLAVSDAKGLAVFDAAGAQIAEHAGKLMMIAAGPHRLACFDLVAKPMKLLELDLDATPAWHEDPVQLAPRAVLIAAHYRGPALVVVSSAQIFHFIDHVLVSTLPMADYDAFMAPNLADGIDVMPSREGGLRFYGNTIEGRIALPVPLGSVHLAGKRGQSRFVAAGNGVVLVFDLADILPKRIAKHGEVDAQFVDDDTLVMWPDDVTDYYFYDLATGKRTPIKHAGLPMSRALAADAKTGRLFIAEPRGHDRVRLVEFTKGQAEAKVYGDAGRLIARTTSAGVIVARDTDPRVLYAAHDGPFGELAKVDGGVQSIITLGHDRFAALSRTGELVRGALAGGTLERIHVDIDSNAFLGVDNHEHAIVSVGTHLMIWDQTLQPLLDLPRAAETLYAVPGGFVVVLDNNAATYVAIGGGKPVLHDLVGASQSLPIVGGEGAWLAALGNGGQLSIVELPSLARWSLPAEVVGTTNWLLASPTKRRLIQGHGAGFAMFDLPEAKGDLGTWLDDRTNAYENPDGFVSWPWLRP